MMAKVRYLGGNIGLHNPSVSGISPNSPHSFLTFPNFLSHGGYATVEECYGAKVGAR